MSKSRSRSSERIGYPFAVLAAHDRAKHALLLLAVEPELRGVLIESASCPSNSILARAFASVLPENRHAFGEAFVQRCRIDKQVIELPLGVTEDRLLGGLDLERTLATGKRHVSAGLLARAHGQVLSVDSVNLLDSDTAINLAHALDSRQVSVERESVSATHAADFVLIATSNPAEGEPNPLLRDRVGLIVESTVDASSDERAEIIERDFLFEKDPAELAEAFAFETDRIKRSIEAGRACLRRVKVSDERRRQIAQISMRLGIEGNRADLFALKAARASAALAGRAEIDDEDLVVAIQLVLAPRATSLPLAEGVPETQKESSAQSDDHDNEDYDSADSGSNGIEDLVIAAIDSHVPKGLFEASKQISRSSRAGKRFKGSVSKRGRYVRSEPRRTPDARLAIDATLRAAAPFQLQRMADPQVPRPEEDSNAATLKSTACRVKIHPRDLRYKKFKHRSGILFIFAVDASGSMALNRMAQAKGALARLLGEAYLYRDKVALISFRGAGSEVLLAPTRSVERAKRLVDAMPAGGGTPIAAGILKAIELARHARLQRLSQAMLLLFTDGRANVRLSEERRMEDELKQVGAMLREQGIASVIVDTKAKFLATGEGRRLAEMLGGKYLFLPRASASLVHDAIGSIAGRHTRVNG